jgi:hypothetical protein
LDDELNVLRTIPGADEDGVGGFYYYQVFDPDQGNGAAVGVDQVVVAVNHKDAA